MPIPTVAPQLTLEIERKGTTAVVRLQGKLVSGTGDVLYSNVSKLIPESKRIVLDLTELSVMDSMGLARLYVCAWRPGVIQNSYWLTAKSSLLSACQMLFLCSAALLPGVLNLQAQCPDTGQTKVIKPAQGTGYRFYRFLGDSSFVYFLDGKTFSFNGKDDPGKTFIFIDDFAYESILVKPADFSQYVKSSKPIDILRAQAKHQQEYFKKNVPSMVITDYGPSARKNPDGSDDRIFYLWKKENPPGSADARQYLVSTLIKSGVVVLSFMPTKTSVSDDDVFLQIQKYTSHFDLLSSDRCAKVLSLPTAP